MATKNELYVSINLDEYKRNKANILASQVDLINSIKHLQKIKQIVEQEKNLKLRLQELFISMSKNLETLEESIPTATLPKSVREISHQVDSTPAEIEYKISIIESQEQPSAIDKELAEIQEKLKQLNS